MTNTQEAKAPQRSSAGAAPRQRQFGLSSAKGIQLIAKREILVQARSRAQQISFLITLLLVAGGIVAVALFGDAIGGGATKVATVSGTQSVASAAGLETTEAASAEEAAQLVRDGAVEYAVLTPADARGLELFTGDGQPASDLGDSQFVLVGLEGVPTEASMALAQVPPSFSLEAPEVNPALGYIMAVAFGVLYFMAAMGYANTNAQSVVEEKQSRIVEILLSTVTPRVIMAGKVIGNSILALIQVAAILAAAAIALAATGQGALFSLIGPGFIWFLVLFVFGFVLIATLYAGASAMVSRQEEVGSVTTPLMMLMLIPYMLVILFNSNALLMTILSYIPFSATIAMPLRVVLGQAEWWEPILALVILIATSAVSIMIGARIYENSILRIGGRVKLSDALKG